VNPDDHICSCGYLFEGAENLRIHTVIPHEAVSLPLSTVLRHGLRMYRLDNDLTRADVARSLGLTVRDVRDIEQGTWSVANYCLTPEQVADKLNEPLSDLLRACWVCKFRPPKHFKCTRCGLTGE